jgi:hypothetical protein
LNEPDDELKQPHDDEPAPANSFLDRLEAANPEKSKGETPPPSEDDASDEEEDDEDDSIDTEIDDELTEEEPLFPPLPWNPPSPPFEEEWLVPPPRPIDKSKFQGSYEMDRRLQISVSLVTGAILLGVSFLPAVQAAGLYLPILTWLTWIGLGFIILAAIINLRSGGASGPYRYLRDGVPMLVRCRAVSVSREGSKENPSFRHQVWIEHPDPLTGEPIYQSIKSNSFTGQAFADVENSYRVGDYITAVYLPEAMNESLTLYGFLGLKKDFGLIKTSERSEWFETEVNFGCAVAWIFFGAILWAIYVAFRYWPITSIGTDMLRWGLAGGLGIGLPLTIWHYFRERRKIRDRRSVRSQLGKETAPSSAASSLVGLPFSLAIWGGIALLIGLSMNALLDRSPEVARPVIITKLIEHESHLLGLPSLRDYRIEYHFTDETTTRRLLSTPADIAKLRVGNAIALVKPGQQGWPWVNRIVPPAP